MNWSTLGQYEQANARHKVQGYMVPRNNESRLEEFERAKAECLSNLQKQIEQIETMTFDCYVVKKPR